MPLSCALSAITIKTLPPQPFAKDVHPHHYFIIICGIDLTFLYNGLQRLYQIHELVQLYNNLPTMIRHRRIKNGNDQYQIHNILCCCKKPIQCSQINLTLNLITHHIVIFQKSSICTHKYFLVNLTIKIITLSTSQIPNKLKKFDLGSNLSTFGFNTWTPPICEHGVNQVYVLFTSP